ncbi:MAG: hypothetical protein L6Q98_02000 [Anaerolineae bacterium]|nr:hypothetical protein [Anaerolineae bacterium]NUQ05868.1 hypothetical protein [Anaerolineae bacterium]
MAKSQIVFVLAAVLMAACSPTAAPPAPTAVPPSAAPLEPTAAVDNPPEAEIAGRPAWQTLALTNARTGETFTLADFAGKTVYIEPMATWCTNCRAQQNIVRDVRNQLGDAQHVYLSLSVETNITGSDLAAYAERENYGWTFAVATPDLLNALVAQFGRTITNPPSTPHFIIYPDGAFSGLESGRRHSAEELVAALTMAGA